MKRKLLVATLCALMMVLAVGAAQAAVFTCSVQGVGMTNSGYYYITLTDTAVPAAFTATNFILATPTINALVANQMYATALTASSKGGNVVVTLPGTFAFATISDILAQ